jgi:hypothetical protein
MSDKLKANLNYSFTNDDIKKYLPDAKIIEYNDLKNYKNIDELLPNDRDSVIMLIETDNNCGHWTSLTKDKKNNRLTYFDSYGLDIDQELKFISKIKRKLLGEEKKLLTDLVDNSEYDVIYNHFPLQSHKDWVSTCGRHNINWLLQFNNGADFEKYINLLKYIVDSKNLEHAKDLKYDLVMLSQVPKPE